MVLKDELIMLFQFYFNDFCRFRKRKGKDRRRRGKRAEGRRQKTACLYPLKNGEPPNGGYPLEKTRVRVTCEWVRAPCFQKYFSKIFFLEEYRTMTHAACSADSCQCSR